MVTAVCACLHMVYFHWFCDLDICEGEDVHHKLIYYVYDQKRTRHLFVGWRWKLSLIFLLYFLPFLLLLLFFILVSSWIYLTFLLLLVVSHSYYSPLFSASHLVILSVFLFSHFLFFFASYSFFYSCGFLSLTLLFFLLPLLMAPFLPVPSLHTFLVFLCFCFSSSPLLFIFFHSFLFCFLDCTIALGGLYLLSGSGVCQLVLLDYLRLSPNSVQHFYLACPLSPLVMSVCLSKYVLWCGLILGTHLIFSAHYETFSHWFSWTFFIIFFFCTNLYQPNQSKTLLNHDGLI